MHTLTRLAASTISAILFVSGSAQAQWLTNGAKIYYNAGKVGIGTENPNSPLQVVSNIGASDRPTLLVKMTNTDPSAFNAAIRGMNRGIGSNGIGVWGSHDGSGFGVYGEVAEDGFGVVGACLGDFGAGVHGQASGIGAYAGQFTGRVYVSDNVGLGVVNPLFKLHLQTDSAAKPTSNTWTISSDRRLKKNIKPIESALAKLMALRGVTYQWKDPSTQGNMAGTYTGMIAQDVEGVFPEWVREDVHGYKTLTVIGFEGIVVEALRELRAEKDAELDTLRAEKDTEIAALTSRIEQLEKIVDQLANLVNQ